MKGASNEHQTSANNNLADDTIILPDIKTLFVHASYARLP